MKKHRIIKKRAARTTTAQAATAPNKGAKTKYNNSMVESQEPNYVEIKELCQVFVESISQMEKAFNDSVIKVFGKQDQNWQNATDGAFKFMKEYLPQIIIPKIVKG